MMNKNRDDRVIKISTMLENSKKTFSLNFKKENYELPVIEIDNEYLIYRLNNTRTKDKQREFIRKDNLDNNFFSMDRCENHEVQALQHDILMFYVNKNSKLAESFDHSGGQTEPIIANSIGEIINGNRRLAYMRSIGTPNIKVAITDNIGKNANLEGKEKEIEAQLDISIDAKEPYSWQSQGLDLIELNEEGFSFEEIKEMKAMTSVKEVKLLIDMTKLAQENLKDMGKEDQWSIVNGSEELYRQAVNKEFRDSQDQFIVSTFAKVLDRTTQDVVGTRKYAPLTDVKKKTEIAKKIILDKFGIKKEIINEFTGNKEIKTIINKESVTSWLKDASQDNLDKLSETLLDNLASSKAKDTERVQENRLKNEVNKASRHLLSAEGQLQYSNQKIEGLKEKLKQIKDIIPKIEDYVDKHN